MKVRTGYLVEAFRIALQSIWAHKMRAFLTLLGIIIGVASVMVVGAGIEGAEAYVLDSVSKALGSNSFQLSKFGHLGELSEEEWQRMVRRNRDLHLEDVAFLQKRCRDCEIVTAELRGIRTVRYRNEEMIDTSLIGTTSNAIFLTNLEISEGRFFSPTEAARARPVCVIGWDLKQKFFSHQDPVGQVVKVRHRPLLVVGVLEKLGSSFGQSLDNTLYLPLRTYQKIFGSRRSITIRGRSRNREDFDSALDQARVAMRIRHKLKPGEEDDFGLISTKDINSTVDQFTGAVAMVVTPITLISLVVGGIVVMNIMLVSVTERTFEVGLRKSLGARRSDVLYQFLIEACLLAALGGLLGLMLAWGVAWVVELTTPIPMSISLSYVLLSVGVSGGIGIIFGLYPAVKASKLDPIVALSTAR